MPSPRGCPQTPLPLRALALLGLALLAACRSADHAMYNLREVVHSDGRAKRTGRPMSGLEYEFRQSLEGLRVSFAGLGGDGGDGPAPAIKDPLGDSVEALLELQHLSGEDVLESGQMVEAFTWMSEPGVRYLMARERAVLALGEAGARLGVDGPETRAAESEAASVEEVAAALRGVVGQLQVQVAAARAGASIEDAVQAAAEPIPETLSLFDDPPPATTEAVELAPAAAPQVAPEPQSLSEACEAVRALDLDRYGARRALSLLNALLRLPNLNEEERATLSDLSWELQRTCVGLALFGALNDPHHIVAAAGIEASVVSSGNSRPDVLRAGLQPVHPVVLERSLRMVRQYGLPDFERELDLAEEEVLRESFLFRLVNLTRHSDLRASVAACRALGAVSGAPFESLRFEDWVRWWRERPEAGS